MRALASSDLLANSYPCFPSRPATSEMAPEKKSATQSETLTTGARGSMTRDQRKGAATSQAQTRSFVLSHSQGAKAMRKHRMKTPIATEQKARDSALPRRTPFQTSQIKSGRLIPKFMTQNFHPPSACIHPGNQRMPDAAEKPPVTNQTAAVAGTTARATKTSKARRDLRAKRKIIASARLRNRNAWTLKNGIVA